MPVPALYSQKSRTLRRAGHVTAPRSNALWDWESWVTQVAFLSSNAPASVSRFWMWHARGKKPAVAEVRDSTQFSCGGADRGMKGCADGSRMNEGRCGHNPTPTNQDALYRSGASAVYSA